MKTKEFNPTSDERNEYPSALLSLGDLANTLTKFASEHYAGLIDVEGGTDLSEPVRISPEGFAYLLKRVLREINGRAILRIGISVVYPHAVIKFSSDDLSFINEGLIELARLSGFNAEIAPSGELVLSAAVVKNPSLFVYSTSTEELLRRILSAFYG